ncbi:MAG: hypothetical protein ACI4C7_10930 [Clostridia bacterium]
MEENKKTYIYKRAVAENSKGTDVRSQFDKVSKCCADKGLKLSTSKLTLTTGTTVLINEGAKMHLPICHTEYCLNYKTEDEAIKNFVRDLELLGEMDKKGSFDGYINGEPFAFLIRVNNSSDQYYFTGGNNIDIIEIKEQYYNSAISKNDIFHNA